MKLDWRSTEFNLVVSALAAALATVVSYAGAGFLGIAILGMAIAYVATQVDLKRDGPAGFVPPGRVSRAERADQAAVVDVTLRVAHWAKVLGILLAAVGFFGFFTLQLPH